MRVGNREWKNRETTATTQILQQRQVQNYAFNGNICKNHRLIHAKLRNETKTNCNNFKTVPVNVFIHK